MEDIYCDELGAFHRGMRTVSSDAKLIAWNYGHKQMALNRKILRQLDPDIIFMDTFEHDGKKKICGAVRNIDEYSLSYVGPSGPFRKLRRCAAENGKQLFAKMQLGHTFETPSMPYVPVPASPYRKFRQMHKLGVRGVMQSWIIGGFPSIMHKAAGEAAFLPLADEATFMKRLAAIAWGEKHAVQVNRAWKHFFKAYDLYPFSKPVFLFGPMAKSPAYHLYLEPQGNTAKPYNWGIERDRTIQPYDDNLKSWLGCLTPDQFITSFRAMADEWEQGLGILRKVAAKFEDSSQQAKELAVAEALCIQFRSCANVIEFYSLRDSLAGMGGKQRKAAYGRMKIVAEDDIHLALQMKKMIRIDSSIGFQSEMQCYSFSSQLIDSKVKQVRQMLKAEMSLVECL